MDSPLSAADLRDGRRIRHADAGEREAWPIVGDACRHGIINPIQRRISCIRMLAKTISGASGDRNASGTIYSMKTVNNLELNGS